jgi:hypothetical protein
LTTTVGALPSAFIAQDNDAKEKILQSISNTKSQYTKTIHLSTTCADATKLESQTNKEKTNTTKITETDEQILDKIMPKENSIT